MKRPLVAVALIYAGGILLAPVPIPLAALYLVAILLALAFPLLPKTRPYLLIPLVLLIGWINSAQRAAVLSPLDLRALFPNREAGVTVRGTLVDSPKRTPHPGQNPGETRWTSSAQIEVHSLREDGHDWQPARGRIALLSRGYLPDSVFAGQVVELADVLHPTPPPLAEGLFNYRFYLENQGVYYEMRLEDPAQLRVISSPKSPPLSDRFSAWARRALALGLPAEDEALRLEWALTLGWKSALPDKSFEPFQRAATYHIFAVDGLRIAIISGIFFALFRAIGIPREYCGLLTAPLILFYAALTGWPASAVRAIVMILVIFLGWALKRPSDLINSLFAAALIILLVQPFQLFQAGFQLSFLVVLCIILTLPFFNKIGAWLLRTDPLLPDSLRPRWQKIALPPARYITDLFLVSLAAWLGSIPLVAYYFHLLTPSSGPANVIAVPLCGLVLICNLASLLTVAWFPFVAILFNHAGWFFMKLILLTSQWAATWPAAFFYVPMPGLFTIALYYFLLLGLLTGLLFRPRWKLLKLSATGLLLLVWTALQLWKLPESRLTILPLEGGHAVYLNSPGLHNDWLIDSGSEFSADTVLTPFLRTQGVNRLSHFVVTHGEASFSGGAANVQQIFKPRETTIGPVQFRSPEYRQFTNSLRAQLQRCRAGDHLGPFEVIYPAADSHFARADDSTLVLRANLNGTRILFMSDLGHAGQNELLNSTTNDLRADIVVAGLPSVGEPLCNPLLDAIQPRLIIIADSDYPASRKAGQKLKDRLATRNCPVIFTSDANAVTFTLRSGAWRISAQRSWQ